MSQADSKYTDPELRARLKEQIQAGSAGGKPGEWSARKSQLLARDYKKAGGGYTGKKDDAAKSLDRWGREDWQTAGGSGDAQHGGSMSRYLPGAVWAMLSPAEKQEAEQSKLHADGQHVEWPAAVRQAMEEYHAKGGGENKGALYAQATKLGIKGRSKMSKAELQKAVKAAQR